MEKSVKLLSVKVAFVAAMLLSSSAAAQAPIADDGVWDTPPVECSARDTRNRAREIRKIWYWITKTERDAHRNGRRDHNRLARELDGMKLEIAHLHAIQDYCLGTTRRHYHYLEDYIR